MTEPDNPYLAPGADLEAPPGGATYQPRLLAWKGRIGRLRYLAYMLALIGIVMAGGMVLMFVATIIVNLAGGDMRSEYVALLPALLGLLFLVPYVGLMVRRMNDTGYTGWLVLLGLVPFVNFLLGLYLLCARGSAGPNKYGLPPCANTMAVKVAGWLMVAVIAISLAVSFVMPFMLAARTGGVSGF